MARYAISDIHGHAHTLERLLNQLEFCPLDELYILGDVLNKGPRSKQVIDLILDYQHSGYYIFALKGNHEDMALNWRVDEYSLQSFSVSHAQEIPQRYFDFMDKLPFIHQVSGWILVHGGIDFSQTRPLEPSPRMPWIRQWQHRIDKQFLGDRYILYGHTPCRRDKMQASLNRLDEDRHLCIDNGCFIEHQMGFGQMVAFDLDTRRLVFQDNVD